jgi:RNA-splicing ligase RtcB
MKMQTLKELQHSIGGRPKFKLQRKKVRLSFYLDIREAQKLKNYAEANDKSLSQVVRESLKEVIKQK